MQDRNELNAKKTVGALTATNVILCLLILTIGGSYIYARFIYQPSPDADQLTPYVAEAEERIDEHADEISAEAADLAQEIVPPVANAVYEQAQEDYPRYVGVLETQGDQFLKDVEQTFVAKVQAQYHDYLRTTAMCLRRNSPNMPATKTSNS